MKLVVLLLLALVGLSLALPLDDYVNAPDPNYKWEHVGTTEKDEYTLYILKLTSQKWLDETQIDRSIWEHWMRIIVPHSLSGSGNSMIYITGGGNPLGNPPTDTEVYLPPIAVNLGDVVVELNQIPNQPIVFAGEDFGRSEDALLAKTWDLFIQTQNPVVIGRFPMVKAVVKAMDAIQEFAASSGVFPVPNNFILAGGSKRGWATWLAAAVDERVNGLAPLVIDILGMQPNMNEIYQTYGRWPIALKDYTNQNLTRCLNCPIFDELSYHEDPLTYIDRFRERNVPIFAINANGDEFFIPIGWTHWHDQYQGEKWLRYMPNAEHSMVTAIDRVVNTLSAFAYTIDNHVERPKFTWELSEDKTQFTIHTEAKPTVVKLWEAHNIKGRAFILNCYLTCLWRSSELPDLGNGTYVGKVEIPNRGFTAFMVEIEFDVGYKQGLVASTGVSIIPDEFVHEPCPDSECALCSTC